MPDHSHRLVSRIAELVRTLVRSQAWLAGVHVPAEMPGYGHPAWGMPILGVPVGELLIAPSAPHPAVAAAARIAAALRAAYDRASADPATGRRKSLAELGREIGASAGVLETCVARLEPANLPVAEAIARRLGIGLPADAVAALRAHGADPMAGSPEPAAARKIRRLLRVAPDQFIDTCPASRTRWIDEILRRRAA